MAIPDVYDALVSARPYKEPFSHEKAFEIIKEGIGTHFDPLIGQAFLHCEKQFKEITQTHRGADTLPDSILTSARNAKTGDLL